MTGASRGSGIGERWMAVLRASWRPATWRPASWRTLVGLALVGLLLGGCPPPQDPGDRRGPYRDGGPDGDGQPTGNTDSSGAPANPTPGGRPTQTGGPGQTGGNLGVATGEPGAAAPTAHPQRLVYEQLSGGVFVPRCPACGEVQREGAKTCPGCSQELHPWRHESVCSLCDGHGQCHRCGDDRACQTCDSAGNCFQCKGDGTFDGAECDECGGSGRCTTCRGDGVVESVSGDVGPTETALPGVCPTCVDGSGYCPDCGTMLRDAAGGECITCGGQAVCPDCKGTGICSHDLGRGYCLGCDGGGAQVVNGPSRLRSAVPVSLRTKGGTRVDGFVRVPPDPNVVLNTPDSNGRELTQALIRSEVHPLSYLVVRGRFVRREDGKGHMELASFAMGGEFWALARRSLDLAVAADPVFTSEVQAQRRMVETRMIETWLKSARTALESGDTNTAELFARMARTRGVGTASATQGDALLLRIGDQRKREYEGLDADARTRIQAETEKSVARAYLRQQRRMERAHELLATSLDLELSESGRERILRQADHAAWTAARMVESLAVRHPHLGPNDVVAVAGPGEPAVYDPRVKWPEDPRLLSRAARVLRAEILVTQAGRALAGGRYEYALRLANIAQSLDPALGRAEQIRAESNAGIARRGVLQGSPPPGRDK